MTLKEFFMEHPKAALAFSGGVDSAYLLYEGSRLGADIKAYFVKSQFQPQFEEDDARRLAEQLQVPLQIVPLDILQEDKVCQNPADRCYFCKKRIFDRLLSCGEADGYSVLLDGTNASDQAQDRPGMRALAEMKILSPLQICGLTKEEIRRRSKEAGLFTWNKPSYACLATRIPSGTPITEEMLKKIEASEDYLLRLGFSDFRIRLFAGAARVQLLPEQMEKAAACRQTILEGLKPYFDVILLDMEGR